MHQIPINYIASMERWYYQYHGPEIVRRYGPWLVRHESFMPVCAPPEAQVYGFYNWRVTFGWWRELPKPGPGGNLAFTVPPVWPKVATCFVPAEPTEDFMGGEFQPWEKSVLRWFIMFKYPEGVSTEEGERWFLHTHVPEVMTQPGLYRFFSYRVLNEVIPLPGTWPAGKVPPPETVLARWDRVCELWYETFDDWRRAVIEAPPRYTKPPWASHETYPFLRPQVDFVSTFLLERPADEFLRDARGYL